MPKNYMQRVALRAMAAEIIAKGGIPEDPKARAEMARQAWRMAESMLLVDASGSWDDFEPTEPEE